MSLQLTPKQRAALRLLKAHDNTLLYGGARSGKTFCVIYWLVYRSLKYEASRHLIARRYASDIRAAVWADTLPKVLHGLGLVAGEDYKANEQYMEIRFPNGSTLVCAGLDDKERVDKILGQEFATIYVNESQDVPWPTIKTLRTRLSQKIAGLRTKFVADLNPTSVAHWTYKLFIKGDDPETGEARPGDYSTIQLNPDDNRVNLADGYIERELAPLVGEARSRFLLGEYSTNTDLQVFSAPSFYEWPEFIEWGENRWPDVRLTAGLDLGVDDPDAFAILAYIDGDETVWLIYEHMARRQGIDELAQAIKAGMDWAFKNVPTPIKALDIWSDTNTVRHGKEGDSKKNARMLAEIYGLPTRAAYKRDKTLGIEFLRDDVGAGRLKVPRAGPFADETTKTIWTKNPVDGSIIREIDDEAFHPNMMDAILYAYRFLMSYGNKAMIGRSALAAHEEPDTYTERMHAALNTADKYW